MGLAKIGSEISVFQNGRAATMRRIPQEIARLNEQQRFLAALQEGWADSEAGRVIDDDELDGELAGMFRPEP
jgi:predicted transcriptional regulator